MRALCVPHIVQVCVRCDTIKMYPQAGYGQLLWRPLWSAAACRRFWTVL